MNEYEVHEGPHNNTSARQVVTADVKGHPGLTKIVVFFDGKKDCVESGYGFGKRLYSAWSREKVRHEVDFRPMYLDATGEIMVWRVECNLGSICGGTVLVGGKKGPMWIWHRAPLERPPVVVVERLWLETLEEVFETIGRRLHDVAFGRKTD